MVDTKQEPGYAILADGLNPILTVGINLCALGEVYPDDERITKALAALERLRATIDQCTTLWMAEHGLRRIPQADLDTLFGAAE